MAVKYISANEIDKIPTDEIKEIFFEASSIKEFLNASSKENFFKRWCGQYLMKFPSHFIIALDQNKVLGYSCSHPNSKRALEDFKIPGQDCFRHLFDQFPLHLHINCHRESRGRGVGKGLIKAQEKLDKTGIHIITEPSADNCGFYRALGFNQEEESNFKGNTLLFMGKKTS